MKRYDRKESARILGCAPDASLVEVKRAYRRMARRWHPDRHPRDHEAQYRANLEWVRVQVAYEAMREVEPDVLEHIVRSARAEPGAGPGTGADRFAGDARLATIVVSLAVVILLATLAVTHEPKRVRDASDRGADSRANVGEAQSAARLDPLDSVRADRLDLAGNSRAAASQNPSASDSRNQSVGGTEDRSRTEHSAASSVDANDVSPSLGSAPSFWLGSSADEVRGAQGEPTAVVGRLWLYGVSRVRFVGDRVVGWDGHTSRPLAIGIPETARAFDASVFTVGSSLEEVAAVMGPPTSVNASVWRYGSSVVRFRGGSVASFSSDPDFPLLTR